MNAFNDRDVQIFKTPSWIILLTFVDFIRFGLTNSALNLTHRTADNYQYYFDNIYVKDRGLNRCQINGRSGLCILFAVKILVCVPKYLFSVPQRVCPSILVLSGKLILLRSA